MNQLASLATVCILAVSLQANAQSNQAVGPNSDNLVTLGQRGLAWSNVFAYSYSGSGSSGNFPFGEASLTMNDEVTLATNHGGITLKTMKYDGVAPINITTNFGYLNASVGGSGAVSISSGNVQSNDPSGDVLLKAGTTASPELRGHIRFVDGSEGHQDYVWTSTNTNGAGGWRLTPYTAANATDWAGAAPTTVGAALDRLAAAAKAANSGNAIP